MWFNFDSLFLDLFGIISSVNEDGSILVKQPGFLEEKVIFSFSQFMFSFNFSIFSYQVLITGQEKIVDHFSNFDGNPPVSPDLLIKIFGLRLVTKSYIPLAVLCEDCHVQIVQS